MNTKTIEQLRIKHNISKEFVKELEYIYNVLSNPKHSIVIIHDNDCDGLLSYLILNQTYSTLSRAYFISKDVESQNPKRFIIPKKTTHILFLDTPVIYCDVITEFMNTPTSPEIIILDHHTKSEEIKQCITTYPTIIYSNPLYANPTSTDSRPITFWAQLLSLENTNTLLYSIIGTVSDFYITSLFLDINFKCPITQELIKPHTSQIIEEIKTNIESNPLYYQIHSEENAKRVTTLTYGTQIGILKQFFDFIFKNKNQAQEHISTLKQLEVLDILGHINSSQLSPYQDFNLFYNKYKKILKKAYKSFDTQENKEYIIIEHRGKTSYTRQLSEQALFDLNITLSCSLHQKYEREQLSGSFRSIPTLNLHKALPQLFKGTTGSFGGHTNACGFRINANEKDILITNIQEYFKKSKTNAS